MQILPLQPGRTLQGSGTRSTLDSERHITDSFHAAWALPEKNAMCWDLKLFLAKQHSRYRLLRNEIAQKGV